MVVQYQDLEAEFRQAMREQGIDSIWLGIFVGLLFNLVFVLVLRAINTWFHRIDEQL